MERCHASLPSSAVTTYDLGSTAATLLSSTVGAPIELLLSLLSPPVSHLLLTAPETPVFPRLGPPWSHPFNSPRPPRTVEVRPPAGQQYAASSGALPAMAEARAHTLGETVLANPVDGRSDTRAIARTVRARSSNFSAFRRRLPNGVAHSDICRLRCEP